MNNMEPTVIKTKFTGFYEQASTGGKVLHLKGKLQQTAPNENDREYGLPMWEALFEDPRYHKRLSKGQIVGGLGHPKDGIFEPEHIGNKLIEQHLEGDNIVGDLEIVPTPVGNIIRTLYESGIELGVSSRGRGPSIVEGGITKVQPGFILEGYDVVVEPSVDDAEPEYLLEEIIKTRPEVNFNTLVEHRLKDADISVVELQGYKHYLDFLFRDKNSVVYNALNSRLTEEIEKKSESLDETSGKKPPISEEITPNGNSENNSINNQPINKPSSMDENQKQIQQLTEERNVLQNKLNEINSATETKKVEEQKQKLAEAETNVTRLSEANTQLQGNLKESDENLKAAKKLVEASVKQITAMKGQLKESNEKLLAATKIIESLQSVHVRADAASFKRKIQETINQFPKDKRSKITPILEAAQDMQHLFKLVEGVKSMMTPVDPTLPDPTKIKQKLQESKYPTSLNEKPNTSGMNPLSEAIAKSQNPALQ